MDKEFIDQVLAFQKTADHLAQSRFEYGCQVTGFVFMSEGIIVLFEYPNYDGSGSILIPWSDLTL